VCLLQVSARVFTRMASPRDGEISPKGVATAAEESGAGEAQEAAPAEPQFDDWAWMEDITSGMAIPNYLQGAHNSMLPA